MRNVPAYSQNNHPDVCLCPSCAPDEYELEWTDEQKAEYHWFDLQRVPSYVERFQAEKEAQPNE